MRFNRYVIATCAAALLAAVPGLAAAASATSPAASDAAPAAAAQPATIPAPPSTTAQPAATAQPAVVPDAVKAWAKFCDPDPKTGRKICIVRKLAFENTSIVGSFLLRIDPGKGVPTLAVAAVPVGIVLKPGLRWQIDGGKPIVQAFWRCTAQSCESEQLVRPDFIAHMRTGKTLTLTAKDVTNKDFVISIPLAGFATAYDQQNAPTFEAYAHSLPH
jgi:invasion protein IalB